MSSLAVHFYVNIEGPVKINETESKKYKNTDTIFSKAGQKLHDSPLSPLSLCTVTRKAYGGGGGELDDFETEFPAAS